jgi:precorrin-2 dehydrogenase/sirohydrochlorin ferrochelatase
MVENLNEYRKTLKGNFEEKVQKMNEITEALKSPASSQMEREKGTQTSP